MTAASALRLPLLLTLGLFLAVSVAHAEPLQATAETFLKQQTQGLPGRVSIQVGTLEAATQLPPCTSHQAFLPSGSRLWGKTYIGIRCVSPSTWSILLPVQISVFNTYIVTAQNLPAGQALQEGDLMLLEGDLTRLPVNVVSELDAALGKTLKYAIAAGQPLRREQLQAPLIIRQGQMVNLVAKGPGFTVSAEGTSLSNAAEGQNVQVRMGNGQVVTGTAKADGLVEIPRY